MIRLTLLALLAATLPAVLADPHTGLETRDRSERCVLQTTLGSTSVQAEVAAQDQADLAEAISANKGSGPFHWPSPIKWIFIPTYFHVIAAGTNLSDGYVPDSQLTAQLQTLNNDYAPHKIKFILLGTTRTINSQWATETVSPSYANNTDEYAYKRILRRGTYKTMNVYFLKTLTENALGYAYLPINVTAGTSDLIIDGITVQYSSVPGGTRRWYGLGKTLVHEVGHWLGLEHPFWGDSCEGPGDYVDDTPVSKESHFGCQIGADSCPNQPGLDPVQNYMEYSDDSCYTNFTPGQRRRMHTIWYQYRDPRPRPQWIWW